MVFCEKCLFLSGLAFCGLLLLSDPASAEESRIWSDKSGKHEIRAKFVDFKAGKVRLERPNGDITRIPIEKLSKEDQKYARNWKKKVKPIPAKRTGPRPLAIGDRVEAEDFGKWRTGVVIDIDYSAEHASVRIDNSGDVVHFCDADELHWPGTNERPLFERPIDPAMADLKIVQPNLSTVLRLLAEGSNATEVDADPQPETATGWKPKSVRLAGGGDGHEQPKDLSIVCESRPLAAVLYVNPFHDSGPPRIELVDLRTRRMIAQGPALPYTERVVLSPSSNRIATLATGDSPPESVGRIDIWNIDGKKVSHFVSFSPYAGASWADIDPEWIAWLDDDHLFTANSEGRIYLWKVDGAEAVYELLADRRTLPVLSPGRNQLAVASVNGINLFSALEGDQLATVGSGNLSNAKLAFSPLGDQIAAVSSGFVDVIDVTTGVMTRSFPCNKANGHRGVTWVDQEYLFIDNSLLINVPRRIVAWEFKIQTRLTTSAAGTHWMFMSQGLRRSQVLAPLQLPPPDAVEAVKALDESDILAIRPGESVAVKVDIKDSLLAKAVTEALEEAVTQAGMTLKDGASLVLHATMKHGETEEINYRGFHDHFGKGETFDVTKRIYKIQLRQGGVTVWKRESLQSPPHYLQMQQGETIRSAVARVMKPTAANFRGRLPTYVVRPEFQGPLGTSEISSGG